YSPSGRKIHAGCRLSATWFSPRLPATAGGRLHPRGVTLHGTDVPWCAKPPARLDTPGMMREYTAAITPRGVMGTPRGVIIGGGLAGMTVALELAKRQWPVTLVESEYRLGGKAGSQHRGVFWEDHGYHIFPAWYMNTRRLLNDIGSLGNLIDLHQFHF